MTSWAPDPDSRIARLRPTAVNAILAEVRALQADGRTLISLMRGEPDLKTPAPIVDAAVTALRAGRTSYPDNRGEASLRAAIAGRLARDHGLEYDPASEILVTDGATLGISTVMTTLVGEGDEVLLPDPVYDAYRSPVHLAGGRVVPVRSEIRDGRFRLDPAAIEAAVTPRSRLLLLNTPWNPTGTVFRAEELDGIAEVVLRHDLLLVSDEIYEAIVYDGHRHIPPAARTAALRERTILVNSLSKTYAMTGWRVGYCAAPAAVVQAMLLVLQQSSRGPATFVQDAAAAALSGPQDTVAAMRQEYAARRATVVAALSGLPGVEVLPPEGGFFAMLDVRACGIADNEIRRRLLHEAGVVVVHGSAYGEGGAGTLRVSFATGGDTLARGLERLREGLLRL